MVEFSLRSNICNDRIIVDLDPVDGLVSHVDTAPPLLRVFKHSARAHREVRPADSLNIEQSLRTVAALARFMAPSGVEWYLSGGIAVDLIKQSAFRRHSDLDIVLPIDQAIRLGEYLARCGVGAYRRICTANYHADDRLTLFRRATPDLKCFGNHRTLKLFMQPGNRVLPVIDLHFVTRKQAECAVLCEREIVSLPFPLHGDRSFSVHGETVRCCNLRLMLYLKSDQNPRNFRDAERLAVELPREEAERIMKLREVKSALGSPGRILGRKQHTRQTAATLTQSPTPPIC